MRPPPSWRQDDRGAASVALVGVVVSATLLCGAVLSSTSAFAVRSRVSGAADAAALAAADTVSGLVTGDACTRAAQVATANGVLLERCSPEGLTVTVEVSSGGAGLPVRATATAGPRGRPSASETAGPMSR